MRTELWGLRNTETQELVLTYWASSQKHKALFSTREKAEDACKHNPQYEPFRIEAESVKHGRWEDVRDYGSGGCYGFCSNCNTGHRANNPTALKMEYRHCRWCGAKMDGGESCAEKETAVPT